MFFNTARRCVQQRPLSLYTRKPLISAFRLYTTQHQPSQFQSQPESSSYVSLLPSPKSNPNNLKDSHKPRHPPKSVLIVNKLRTKPVIDAIDTLLTYVHQFEPYPNNPFIPIYYSPVAILNLLIPGQRSTTKIAQIFQKVLICGIQVRPSFVTPLYYFFPLSQTHACSIYHAGKDAAPIDLVVTLGGDGTILHASSLFKAGAVPPVLSFSMGTLGFLLPFRSYAVFSTHCRIFSF